MIAQAKDLDLLLAQLKGDGNDALLCSLNETTIDTTADKTQQSEYITPLSVTDVSQISCSEAPADDPKKEEKKDKKLQDLKTKLFKSHMELVKHKQLLEECQADLFQSQEELKQRNQEMYEMNAKLILMEYQGASVHDPLGRLNNLQERYDRLLDQQVRRQSDVQKLRQALIRLRQDINVVQMAKRTNQNNSIENLNSS